MHDMRSTPGCGPTSPESLVFVRLEYPGQGHSKHSEQRDAAYRFWEPDNNHTKSLIMKVDVMQVLPGWWIPFPGWPKLTYIIEKDETHRPRLCLRGTIAFHVS